jgi:hypothetical protein
MNRNKTGVAIYLRKQRQLPKLAMPLQTVLRLLNKRKYYPSKWLASIKNANELQSSKMTIIIIFNRKGMARKVYKVCYH